MYIPYYGMDWTYLLVLAGAVLCIFASLGVKSTFAKYSKVRCASGISATEVARRILLDAGINDVKIERISGNLTDNYDPTTKTLHLSDSTINSNSVAAIGVAAHECGHAIQHATDYAPLGLRKTLVPITQFGSAIAWPLIIIGLIFRSNMSSVLLNLGIIAFSVSVLFALVTLPVEFNASRRAVKILRESSILTAEEVGVVKKVLTAAAMTYVASAAAAILNLLRIILISNNRRD